VHVQIPAAGELMLRRPFSVYEIDDSRTQLSIVYQVVGRGSKHIQELKVGEELNLLGPCGQGWRLPDVHQTQAGGRVLLVGGGIGTAALQLLAAQLATLGYGIDFVVGAATARLLVFNTGLEVLVPGLKLHVCTDDGSAGHRGLTTDLAEALLSHGSYEWLASCGPEPMLAALASLAKKKRLAHQVSLEARMACGVGACLGCVVPTLDGQRRVCADGPVFDAEAVVW
jgi:dihydroorotate dehydrogenase electron transfer subunit